VVYESLELPFNVSITSSHVLLQAFMQGKLKLSGNVGLALKLNELKLKSGHSKL